MNDVAKEHIDEIEFQICGTVLISMTNHGEPRDISIPHIFPDGRTIHCIDPLFCNGEYLEIKIANEITDIMPRAFKEARCQKVVWSSGCKTIPFCCFQKSTIKGIANIEGVETIEQRAFENTRIRHIDWPSKCIEIPGYCFLKSELRTISNIQEVQYICTSAFELSQVREFAWPTKCKTIPERCFWGSWLGLLSGIENVISIGEAALSKCSLTEFEWPSGCFYVPDQCFYGTYKIKSVTNLKHVTHIGNSAFVNLLNLESLDLSEAPIQSIGKDAFAGTDKKSILLPYYMSDECT